MKAIVFVLSSVKNNINVDTMKKKRNNTLSRKYKTIILKEVFSLSSKDIDYIAKNIVPLSMNDRLFVESMNPNDPRLMPSNINNELYYELGYLCTTIFLLNIIEFGKSYLHKDSYIYPALFCFRQYIENMIKTIGRKYDANIKFKSNKHDLMEFWAVLLKYIENTDDVKNVGNIICELQNSDSKATAYRYPGALNSAFNHNQHLYSMLIDVKTLRIRVLQVYRFFDGLYEDACHRHV